MRLSFFIAAYRGRKSLLKKSILACRSIKCCAGFIRNPCLFNSGGIGSKAFYLAIREAAGDDVLIMGCNTFSHLSAGIMDIQRTGDDTSGREWERTKKYGVNTLAFRMMQHGAFYQVDADCVGITCDVPWEKNAQWLDVLAKSGTPLFVSIGEDAFTPQVEMAIRAAFETADKTTHVSTPVDWLETKTPRVWDSQFTRDTYDW